MKEKSALCVVVLWNSVSSIDRCIRQRSATKSSSSAATPPSTHQTGQAAHAAASHSFHHLFHRRGVHAARHASPTAHL